MKVPISWLKDFVEITLSAEELAERLTLAGLEVGSIGYVGVEGADLVWDREKLVLGHLLKVEQHPQADRLVLATVDIGAKQPETVVTGAPNLFDFVGQGDISRLGLKSPFVMEGATVYDGHAKEPGVKMKLKGREIRGIMNRHMLCSEKELGLSDEHEGIILTREEAAPGTPIVDLWGDAVLDIDITPNIIRCASILGVAREVAALTGQKLRYPDTTLPPVSGKRRLADDLIIETTHPELNPRFVAILIEGITIKESPYWMQRRLRLAGMRPINNVVDISNYVMLEMGQPNHAFDWDVLRRRALNYNPPLSSPPVGGIEGASSPPVGGTKGGHGPVKIITRLAQPGETVLTLDGKTHAMPEFSILVTDPQGNLSIGGIMGGGESEVSEHSQNILLEAAAWNFINIRRTSQALNIKSEAAYRFSRGVHPSQAMFGALRGAKLMADLTGGTIAEGVLDYYPNPPQPVVVTLHQAEVTRLLGVELSLAEIKNILESLEFNVEALEAHPKSFRVVVPDHRLDISADLTIGQADLVEEIARIYGYDRLPVSEMADELPPQRNNVSLDREERVRDLLVQSGLQEVITYRLTTPAAEARILGAGQVDNLAYVTLANPSTPERVVMRHSLLNSVLEIAAENSKHHRRVQVFEVGHIYLPPTQDMINRGGETAILPVEQRRLALVMTGVREEESWLEADVSPVDFFDLKGVVESVLAGLHVGEIVFSPARHPAYYPGRVAELSVNGQAIGVLGQLHPQVVQTYDLKSESDWPVLAADFDLDRLLAQVPDGHVVKSVPRFPPVQQDIAVIVDEAVPAEQVQALITQTGRPLLTEARLFDLFRGEQIGAGKKSLAYSLTFQTDDRTLTDRDAAKQQQKIVQRLERELGAKLRS
ncbi:MAG: phenylalanine--tRNA ligase beta subunit [Chloroflexota bacterium]|nr:MAG: phenylalanine--tRNA ligase beta subunit [Chloroflexota bacterium]